MQPMQPRQPRLPSQPAEAAEAAEAAQAAQAAVRPILPPSDRPVVAGSEKANRRSRYDAPVFETLAQNYCN